MCYMSKVHFCRNRGGILDAYECSIISLEGGLESPAFLLGTQFN